MRTNRTKVYVLLMKIGCEFIPVSPMFYIGEGFFYGMLLDSNFNRFPTK